MGLCISKTGAIYYDGPATQQELKERQQSASCAKAIALRRFKTGRHAFLAVTGDVQVGWCSRRKDGWYIEDMDCETLAGPFMTLAAASSAGGRVLADLAGESNPRW